MNELLSYNTWRKSVSQTLLNGFIKNTFSKVLDSLGKNKVNKAVDNPFEQMMENSKIIDSCLTTDDDDLIKWANFPEVQPLIAGAAYIASEFYTVKGLDDDVFKLKTYNVAQKMCLFTILMEEAEKLLNSMKTMSNMTTKLVEP